MGFRYRKSIKILPGVRMTLSKSGVSYSAGGKGLRVTRTASGKVQKSVGIPGTGIHHVSSASSTPRRATTPPPRPSKPGVFAPKGQKALYNAVAASDVGALERLWQEHPEHAIVAASLAAVLHLNTGNDARARELLVWVLDTGQEPTNDPVYRKFLKAGFTLPIAAGVSAQMTPTRDGLGLLLAELLQQAGDLAAAIVVVESLAPSTLTAVSLAELYGITERHDDVIALTNGMVNGDDATALLCVFRGKAFRALGRTEAARESLREALKSKKRDAVIRHAALTERALTYLQEGKKAMATKDAERLMAEDATHPDLQALLAAIEGS